MIPYIYQQGEIFNQNQTVYFIEKEPHIKLQIEEINKEKVRICVFTLILCLLFTKARKSI